MNTPNKLTLLRVVLIPVFVVLMFAGAWLPYNMLWALFVFVFASVTDWFDGYLARRDNLVTNFGILMDPLADKLLVAAALICFVELRIAPSWVVIIIISREFLVTSIRLVAAGAGKVIAADKIGKYKTASQMIWVAVGILYYWLMQEQMTMGGFFPVIKGLHYVLMAVVVVLTTVSGFNYIIKNKEVFSQ